jgi:eukaryotic-like serine/threonine-protein kinase
MQAQRWQQTKEIFFAALDREPATREAFLREACAGDEEMLAEVRSLLAAHADSDTGDFITNPPTLPEPAVAARISWIGRRLGGYRVVEELGHGGMSEVYRAVRDDEEFHKEVAVKVLRSGYDTDTLLRRFGVERQILATLDHPNIARLLDAGSTEEKLPYIVMDYIKGRPIDEYCREQRLGVRQRLELLRTLCDAVQYVHRHLMVHGDLKCTNILVTDDGKVKLLDFGIAQLLAPMAGLPASAKPAGLVALTPEYASPEQVRGLPITTSSDVYSLGVLLYRLLTGTSPYRVPGGATGSFSPELARQILEHQPFRPSVSVQLNEQSSTKDGEYAGFWPTLAGDIDSIALQALRKDPAERYASVEQLGADIGRYLGKYPVLARGPSVGYQFTRFVNRHRFGAATAALLVVSLVGGIVGTTRQAQIAERERARAERHFESVRKLADTFMFDVHGQIETLPGATPARQMLVENSLKYLSALTAEAGDDADLQRDLASAYEKVADVQGGFRSANLGDTAGAIRSYGEALAIRVALVSADPRNRDLQRELLRNHGKLAEISMGAGDSQAALEHSNKALAIAEQLAASPQATLEDRRNVASGHLTIGYQLAGSDQLERGVALMGQAATEYNALLQESPGDPVLTRHLSLTHSRIGEKLLESTDRHAQALDHYERAFQLIRTLSSPDPQNTRLVKVEAYALLGMAEALLRQGSAAAALEKQEEAAKMLQASLDADPKNETARFDAAYSLGEASESLIALGKPAQAERLSGEALAILALSVGAGDSTLNSVQVQLGVQYWRSGVANAMQALTAATSPGQRDAFCQRARQAFGRSEPILAAADKDDRWRGHFTVRSEEARKHLAACAPIIASTRPAS